MKTKEVKIIEKKQLNHDVYKFTLYNADGAFTAPGQLARIYSGTDNGTKMVAVTEFDSDRFVIVFRADDLTGAELSRLEAGDLIKADLGIGNGFNLESIPNGSVLAGEGMGIPVILSVLKNLFVYGKDCRIVLGYESKEDIIMLKAFRDLASNLEIITADGSNGRKGHIYNVVRNETYVCAAAPDDILRELSVKTEEGQFASIEYFDGEGPVFDKSVFDEQNYAREVLV